VGAVHDDARERVIALRWFDVAGRQRLSVPGPEKGAGIAPQAFSPDGRVLVGRFWTREAGRGGLKFWEAATGRELASFEPPRGEPFGYLAVSPDGQTLAVASGPKAEQARLLLFDVPGKRPIKSISLGGKALVRQPVFSPDSRWVAALTQVMSTDLPGQPRAADLPQPRIHLVEVGAGAVRETLVAPQAIALSACFSPDGKTLATGGQGKLLLWDLTAPLGDSGTEGKER
jgi:WD40 repeat protein